MAAAMPRAHYLKSFPWFMFSSGLITGFGAPSYEPEYLLSIPFRLKANPIHRRNSEWLRRCRAHTL